MQQSITSPFRFRDSPVQVGYDRDMKDPLVPNLSRRDFLKVSGLAAATAALPAPRLAPTLPEFPQDDRLGRVLAGKADLKARPDVDSPTVAVVYEDDVLPWLREAAGWAPNFNNQRWVETPQGYIRSPYLQPVRSLPSLPLEDLPETSLGPGLWVEVNVPFVNLQLANPPARSPALKELARLGLPFRLYYSQVVWVDRIRTDEAGLVLYRINEKFGTFGDIFWADARAFRPLTAAEIAPINPDAEEKRVVVDLTYQTLSCYEGRHEVYFARIAAGVKFDAQGAPTDLSSTPLGNLTIWRKLISLHMSGGTSGLGWDLSGVAWTTLFAGNGVAVHSTFWHNNFGSPMSRGCVNASPEDSKWVFRWTNPPVAYDPGDLTISWPGGTRVHVIES